MAQTTADVVALQLEQVKRKLPLLYAYEDVFWNEIDTRKDALKVSSRLTRVPLQTVPGSRFGSVNLAGGAMGRGSGTHYDFGQLSPIPARVAIELQEDAIRQTEGEPKAIRNLVAIEVKNAMKEMRTQMNAQLQTAGNGVIGTTSQSQNIGDTSITVHTTPFFAQLLRGHQIVQVYDTTITTNRGAVEILNIDYPNSVLNLVNPLTFAVTSGDVLVPENLSGASPVWFFGIPYNLSDSSTGTFLQLSRSTVPAIRANAVHNNNNSLTTFPIRLLITKIIQRVGTQAVNPKSFRAHLHDTQRSVYEELAVLVSSIQKGSGNESVDMLFGDQRMAGVQQARDIHAARDRIDFLMLDSWGKVESSPVDFFKRPDGTYFERPIDSGTGSPLAALLFYILWFGQTYTDNPAIQGYIDQLPIPAGYDLL